MPFYKINPYDGQEVNQLVNCTSKVKPSDQVIRTETSPMHSNKFYFGKLAHSKPQNTVNMNPLVDMYI